MNSIMEHYWPTFELYQAIRWQIMAVLSDEDLRFAPGGTNEPFGELCKDIGETERAYIESFKVFTLDFSYKNPNQELAQSVERLRAWYAELDRELREVIEGLSEEQVQNQLVDRGADFKLPVQINLSVYQEALLIFYGKASVYLKAMNTRLPEQMHRWIG